MIIGQQVPIIRPRYVSAGSGGGGGASGNLANVDFEDGTTGVLTPVVSVVSGTGVSVVSTTPFAGTKCCDLTAPNNSGDQGIRLDYSTGVGRNTWWITYAVYWVTRPLDMFPGTQKFTIFRNDGGSPNQFGEFNVINNNWIWNWLFTDAGAGNITIPEMGTVASYVGAWNRIKLKYSWLGAGLGTTIVIGKNGTNNIRTIHTANDQAGVPSRLTIGGTLNANSGPSHFRIDNVHIGTVDPGWD